MTIEELGSKLAGLEVTRRLALDEIAAVRARDKRAEELERDRDSLLESWVGAVPRAFDELTGLDRNKVYRLLRLEVTPTADGFGVTGALGGILGPETDATAAAPTPSAPPAASSTWRASPSG